MNRASVVLVMSAVATQAALAGGDVVVDHPPLNTGGHAADTEYVNDFGEHTWSLLADDFTLATAVDATHLRWWGFYGSTFGGDSNQPPLGDETMRIRFYGSEPLSGLPDSSNVLIQETFLNPARAWTGRTISGGTGAREYSYDATLTNSVPLLAGIRYWVEIVQVGDINSHFRWEISVSDRNGIAYVNPLVATWQTTGNYSLAFQLSAVPEPHTLMLTALVVSCVVAGRRRTPRCR